MAYGDTCSDCQLFDHAKGVAGQCSWGIPECKGPKSKQAELCPLFTDENGVQWMLECPEEELPEWTRTDQLTLEL